MLKRIVLHEAEPLDEATLKLVRAAVHKRASAVVAYGNYVARALGRNGIHCSTYSSIDVLPDGFRIVLELRVVSVDKDILAKARRSLYLTAFDYVDPRKHRRIERLINTSNENESEGIEDVGGVEDHDADTSG